MSKRNVRGFAVSSILSSVLVAGCGSNTTQGPGQTGSKLTLEGHATGSQVIPPTSSAASGSIQLSLDPSKGELTYTLTYDGVVASGAQLSHGMLGANGAAAVTLKSNSGATDTIQVTADQMAGLSAGEYYLNLQSAAFATGELRAQIFPVGDAGTQAMASGTTTLSADLTGLQLLQPLSGAVSGSANLVMDDKTGELSYTINDSLAVASAVNLKQGGFDVEGTLLTTLQSGGTLPLSISGKQQLSAEQGVLAKSGLLYLEVVSSVTGTAALRGQILSSKAEPFNVSLSAAPLVITSATGTASFFLSADKTKLAYRLSHDLSNVSGASIIKSGLDATAVCVLSTGQNQAQGSCDVKASAGSASDLTLDDLMNGKLLVNIATGAHATGELRGTIQVPPSP